MTFVPAVCELCIGYVADWANSKFQL